MQPILSHAAGLLGGLVVVTTCVWWMLSWMLRRRLERLRQLIPKLGGTVGWRPWWIPCWSGTFEGLPVSVSVVSEWEYLPPSLNVALEIGASWSLWVARESRLTGWAKRLGLREVTVHEPLFGRSFLLLSRQPAKAERVLRDAAIQRSIRELFAWGCQTLTINQRQLMATKSGVTDQDLGPRTLQQIFAELRTLRAQP